MNGNISTPNHIIHFLFGVASFKINYITPIFLIYQLIDGFKFKYKLKTTGLITDDLTLDLLFFSLGSLCIRYFYKYKSQLIP